MKLVVVESPAKAKTINKYLGKDFRVVASFGHIRDLPPKNGSVLPDEDFAIKYEIPDKSAKYVSEIAKAAKEASLIYLATDPDREGESISWHVMQVLKQKKIIKDDTLFKRVAFNEITKKAVLAAIAHPRTVDDNLVHAQIARRALDYLVGFTLSPILWRKLPGCKSAGRVQSVALRLICEREEEIERFVSQEYWDVTLDLTNSAGDNFSARLTHIDGNKLEKFSVTDQKSAEEIVARLEKNDFIVANVEKKQQKRNPPSPFITSSLQQEASRKLGFSAKKTMQIAQKLYEGVDIKGETIGLITYMRTDGVTLSGEAVESIRKLVESKYGSKYVPASARIYKSKAKNAQEAHEAIRPTDINLIPDELTNQLEKDQFRLYELIWKRTVACQMESVVIDMVVATIDSKDDHFSARATGSVIAFDGFYKVYQESRDDSEEEKNKILPPLAKGQDVNLIKVTPEQHFTEPPPRYSEASLVKSLEELGIGRPSTYASIISVLQERNYATLEKKRFYPSDLGRLVTIFLTNFFERYVAYDFTAKLEDDLDRIAEGELAWKGLLAEFWQGFKNNIDLVSDRKITEVIDNIEKSLDFYLFGDKNDPHYLKNKTCPSCSTGQLGLKLGKYGAFLACSNYPDCTFKKPIAKKDDQLPGNGDTGAEKNIGNSKALGKDPEGREVYLKKGPYGWYVQLGEVNSGGKKPKRVALPSGLAPESIDLRGAMNLLNLPLTVGQHTNTNEDIILGIGKFGPYLKYQNKFVSIPKSLDIFTIDLEKAMEIIAAKNSQKKD